MTFRGPDIIDAIPKHFSLIYNPPAFIIDYFEPSTGKTKRRVIKINTIYSPDANCHEIANWLIRKNKGLLSSDRVSFE